MAEFERGDLVAPPFKRGDVVWCNPDYHSSEEPSTWRGLAIIQTINLERGDMAVGVTWITCSADHYFNHADGCDAYVPVHWLTKIEGIQHD